VSQETWEVPELGPSLGRLTDPAQPGAGPLGIRLDDIRLKLVTGVFELAGAGRSFAAAGDAVGSETIELPRPEEPATSYQYALRVFTAGRPGTAVTRTSRPFPAAGADATLPLLLPTVAD